MSYTQADLEQMTGKELDQVRKEYEAADIAPAGWGKMVVTEKRSWLKRYLDQFRKATQPARMPGHVREKKRWDALKRKQKSLADRHGARVSKPRVIEFIAGANVASDPEPMTRQVRRQHERRTEKSVLSASLA